MKGDVFPQRVHGVCQAATASGARSQDFNGEEQTSRYQKMDRTHDRAIRIASDDTASRKTQKRYLTPFSLTPFSQKRYLTPFSPRAIIPAVLTENYKTAGMAPAHPQLSALSSLFDLFNWLVKGFNKQRTRFPRLAIHRC